MQERIKAPFSRWSFIDLIESIAMLLVVISHAVNYPMDFLQDSSAVTFLRYFTNAFYCLPVPLFFFANGFLLFNKKLDLKKHIVRTVSLVVLTCIWGVITILCTMAINHEQLSLHQMLDILVDLSYGWVNHLWYMGALVCIYIAFPLLKSAFDHDRKSFLFFLAACLVFSFGNGTLCIVKTLGKYFLSGHTVSLAEDNFFNMYNPLRGLQGFSFSFFCLGGAASLAKDKIEGMSRRKKLLIALSVLSASLAGLFVTGVAVSAATGSIWNSGWGGMNLPFSLFAVCAVFMLSLFYAPARPNFMTRLIETVSANTLGIYLIHFILIRLTRQTVTAVPLFQTWTGCLLYSFAILMLSLFLSLALRKVPLLHWLADMRPIVRKS